VDTGLGPDKQEPRDVEFGHLLEEFRKKGISLDEVDMVVMTHVHRDHVGWNLVRDGNSLRPTFPRARYWAPRADWQALQGPEGMRMFPHVRDQVFMLDTLGLLELMEGEQSLTAEITALPTPGHTPGHTSLLVSSGGERCLVLGDAAHHPVQVQEVGWSPFFDVDPAHAAATRRSLIERVEREGLLMAAGHFPAPGFGRVVRVGTRRRWNPL
jgi:glyoxylase-like metal-dependent hydrolase (beta-lactamase superfamily II)